MEKNYWIDRERAAMTMARAADSSEARLGFYELAERCSIRATQSPPFLFVRRPPAVDGHRATLHLPGFLQARPDSVLGDPLPAEEDGIGMSPPKRR